MLQMPLRWPALIELADRHAVTFLLHEALCAVEDQVPAHEMHRLQQRYRLNIHKSMFFSRELIRIMECVEALGIEVMPYKGVVLAEALYANTALRQSGDIDLLIHARDLPRIREAVRELGYTPHLSLSSREERAYVESGYECAFDSPLGRNLLELHWALQPRFYAVDIDIDDLIRRSATVHIAGRSIRTLSKQDLLIVLSLHAAKHAWARLIWLCDIARVAAQPDLDWSWIKQQADKFGVRRILYVGLTLANRLLHAHFSADVNAALSQDRVSRELAEEVITGITNGANRDAESLSYFHLMLRLRERPSDQMRFLTRLLFTPGPGEWSAVRLPSALFPLYRVVRLSRLAARVARA